MARAASIVIVEGAAEQVDGFAPEVEAAYLAKYDASIRTRMQSTPEALRQSFSASFRIRPRRICAW